MKCWNGTGRCKNKNKYAEDTIHATKVNYNRVIEILKKKEKRKDGR